jgi:quercetin dioxygenase-like cupin family protein
MELKRWHEEPVEALSPSIGRQVVNTGAMTIARILLQKGAGVPAHQHPNEQVANVLSGSLRFVVDGEELIASAGESVVIPPDVPHAVEALEESIVLDVFAPPREDWLRGDDGYLRG